MKLGSRIGKLFIFGEVIGGVGRMEDHPSLARSLERGEAGGFYLGYPHFNDPVEARRLIARLRGLSPHPLLMAADFEAGPGSNCVEGCAHFPYLMGLGELDDPRTVRRVAEITARQARAMGLDWLFSPCVDVNLRPDNPIIGIRAFGEDPARVARLASAFIAGCRTGGVVCTAKHFPGTGNTAADTHVECARDMGDLATWERQTLPPFARAVAEGVPAIMTGHAAMSFLDPTGCPATFSAPILRGVLRERLGFEGVLISDHLGMGGVTAGDTPAERCIRAFEAGCDMLLTPFAEDIVPAFEAAVRAKRIEAARLEASLARVAVLREWAASAPVGRVGPGDQAFAFTTGRRAARIRWGGEHLPLQAGTMACLTQWRNDEAQYFPREPGILARLQQGVHAFDPAAPLVALSRECPPTEHAAALRAIGDRRQVVVLAIVKNYAADPWHGRLSGGTVQLLRALAARGKELFLVILGSPYAALDVPEARGCVWAGGDSAGCAAGVLDKLLRRIDEDA